MNSINTLKTIIEGKTVGILVVGASLSQLEKNIEKFRNKNIIWLSFNYGAIVEKYILSKINRHLDITCDFSIHANWKDCKEYEETIRIPYLISSIDKGIYTVTGRRLIKDLFGEMGLSSFYDIYKDKVHFLEDIISSVRHTCTSSLSEIMGFLLRCNPKRIILFGYDGYDVNIHGTDILKHYYRGQELYDRFPKDFPIGTKVANMGGDCIAFENHAIEFFNNTCTMYGTKLPEILNCSEVSMFTNLKKVTYEEVENIIEDKPMLTKQELLDFESDIADLYNKGLIHSPIHLDNSTDGSLENFLIKFFKDNNINKETWLFSTHRNHIPWLLSGRSPEELKKQILEGHSMHIFGHKFFTSAIVGGIAPIALGVAKALAMKKSDEKVFCFLGDMSGESGLVTECIKYAEGWDLPIIYVILDNKKSVRANTKATWGQREGKNKVVKISYDRVFQHAGGSKEGEEKRYIMF